MDNGAGSYRRFLDGDDSGLVEIISLYKSGLMLYLNSFVKNIHTAEDLTEDTFVKLVMKRPHFSGNSSFKTWLYAIGGKLALMYLRKNKHTPTQLSEKELAGLVRDESDVESDYLRNEQNRLLHTAMKALYPEHRRVLCLAYFEDLSNAEIAKIMHKTKRQIETLLYRAKQNLKDELAKKGVSYEIR